MGWCQTETLLDRVGHGDDEALGELYDRHARLVNALARSILRDRAEAEDVVQEVFVQVWRQAARFDPLRGTCLAWLSTIARTRALDRLRRRACRREQPVAVTPDAAATPASEESLAVRMALRDLSPEQRRALELSYYEGLTHIEIAWRLGRPLGTIKTWIRKAMLELRDALAPEETRLGPVHAGKAPMSMRSSWRRRVLRRAAPTRRARAPAPAEAGLEGARRHDAFIPKNLP